ncbi:MAG TPA: Imm63 family immunity protein [Anaerolineales bacterium]|nr:Imm63 family immunity protein [Anaerolineales bacterium]
MREQLSLNGIKSEIDRLAAKIEAPKSLLPTYGHSIDGAHPHIEVDARGYHYIVVERGQEDSRVTTTSLDELLFEVFKHITFSLACQYELKHRIEGQDFRRLLFRYQEALLSMLSSEWAEREAREHERILQNYPYDDQAIERANFSKTLREQGLSPELAWKQACEKFPLLERRSGFSPHSL